MLKIKRIFIILFVMLILGLGLYIFFKDQIYQTFFSYNMIGVRTQYPGFKNHLTYSDIDKKLSDDTTTIELVTLIQDALMFTDKYLFFSKTNTKTNPNELLTHGKAHCVGYSAFFKATLEYFLWRRHVKNVDVYHVVGKVHFLGIDTHQFSKSTFS